LTVADSSRSSHPIAAPEIDFDYVGWINSQTPDPEQQYGGFEVQETVQEPTGTQFPDVQYDENLPVVDPGAAGQETTQQPQPQPQPKGKGKAPATGKGKRKAAAAVEDLSESDQLPKKRRAPRKGKATTGNDVAEDDATPPPKPALIGHVAPPDWIKMDGLRAPEPPRKLSGDFFDSYEEVLASMSPPDWMPPADDHVPQTTDELRPYMRLLRDAMMDMSEFKDKLSNNSLKKRWLDENYETTGRYGPVLTNPYYMPQVLEGLAWKIAVSNLIIP